MPGQKTWLITGCSSGIGRSLAEAVLATGDHVAVSARNMDSVGDIVERYPATAIAVSLDVTSQSSIDAAVAEVLGWRNRIDVLVNNAGFGTVGCVEEIDEDEARLAFDANFFGVHRMCRAVLPAMRSRRQGHILNISSMIGFVGQPGFSIYSAAKFAVEGLSESLAAEVAPLGVSVTIVEPGPFRTDFRNRSMRVAPAHAVYLETLGDLRRKLAETDGTQPGDPAKAAALMIALVRSDKPTLRLPLGEICMTAIRHKIASVEADLEHWQAASRATAFGE